MSDGSQQFIGRNRPPRVHIEYVVERNGAERVVEIPFVMGVMADLKGNAPEDPVVPINDRKFLDINVDNFNNRLKSLKPHVKTTVPDMLTGKGNLEVDLIFEHMDDFLPGAIARKVKGVKELLEARMQLDNLLTQMDGKSAAEDLISDLINDENLMQALISASKTNAESSDSASNNQPSQGEE